MEFLILTIISTIALVYCCDIPIICSGFEFLVNDKHSLLYGVGLSIIASYIFYIIQVVMPQKRGERQAYSFLEKKIESYLNDLDWMLKFCESLCNVNREENVIDIKSQYVTYCKNGQQSKWIAKVDVAIFYKKIQNEKKAILESGYFMQLEYKKREALQHLFDNRFMYYFNEHLVDKNMVYGDLIKSFDEFKKYLDCAMEKFEITDILELREYTDVKRILEFEMKIQNVKKEGIIYMKIKN